MRSSSQRKSQRTDRAPVPWQRPWRPSVGSDALRRGTSANQVCRSTSFALAPTVRLQARPSRPAGCGGWSRRMTTLRSLADWPRRSSSTRVDRREGGRAGGGDEPCDFGLCRGCAAGKPAQSACPQAWHARRGALSPCRCPSATGRAFTSRSIADFSPTRPRSARAVAAISPSPDRRPAPSMWVGSKTDAAGRRSSHA